MIVPKKLKIKNVILLQKIKMTSQQQPLSAFAITWLEVRHPVANV